MSVQDAAQASRKRMTLSKQQLEQYSSDGFLIINDFVSTKDCEALRTRAEELVNEFDPSGLVSIFTTREQNRVADDYFLGSANDIRFFFEENAFHEDGTLKQQKQCSINKIGHALHYLDPVFTEFSESDDIRQLADDLNITNPELLQSMYIFKQPNIGGEVSCHQDGTFLYTEPLDIVGLWFALEDATVENGCLWAIPGGHKRGLKSRWVRNGKGGMELKTFDPEPWPEDELVPLEVKKGSLILLHGLLPHRSLENHSPKSRHAYTLHFISEDAHYPADNWLQKT